MELDALDLYFTICLDGTNEVQHNNNNTTTTIAFDSVDYGLSNSSSSLCSRYPISIPSGFRGGTCIQQKFPLSGSNHQGGVSRDGKTKFNEISLCFWMDINHTSHSLAFLSSFCVGGIVGTGAQVPQTAPPSILYSRERVIVIMNGMI